MVRFASLWLTLLTFTACRTWAGDWTIGEAALAQLRGHASSVGSALSSETLRRWGPAAIPGAAQLDVERTHPWNHPSEALVVHSGVRLALAPEVAEIGWHATIAASPTALAVAASQPIRAPPCA